MSSLPSRPLPEQKAQFLPKIASGELRMQAFGVSEPNSGTDTLSLETNAKLAEDGSGDYVVNGQKMWTSRAEYSDLMLLLARTTSAEDLDRRQKSKALSLFILDMNEAKKDGLSITPVETMMNHSTTTVFFDNVKVPKENMVGEKGAGFSCILSSMNAERILIASECIGDGRYFIEKAVKYVETVTDRLVVEKG